MKITTESEYLAALKEAGVLIDQALAACDRLDILDDAIIEYEVIHHPVTVRRLLRWTTYRLNRILDRIGL